MLEFRTSYCHFARGIAQVYLLYFIFIVLFFVLKEGNFVEVVQCPSKGHFQMILEQSSTWDLEYTFPKNVVMFLINMYFKSGK